MNQSRYLQMRTQLAKDFKASMDFFNLPEANRRIAWDSALRSEDAAARCYRAIVNSLPRGKECAR